MLRSTGPSFEIKPGLPQLTDFLGLPHENLAYLRAARHLPFATWLRPTRIPTSRRNPLTTLCVAGRRHAAPRGSGQQRRIKVRLSSSTFDKR